MDRGFCVGEEKKTGREVNLVDRREAREKIFWEKREKIGTSGSEHARVFQIHVWRELEPPIPYEERRAWTLWVFFFL
jgi:hypothetical protein